MAAQTRKSRSPERLFCARPVTGPDGRSASGLCLPTMSRPPSSAASAALPAFDPRLVPVVHGAADAGLLPAPAHRLTPSGLRELFADPPAWTPEVLRERRFSDRAPAQAAVLLPLVMRDRLSLLLTRRTPHLSTHSGQIALPGGKLDETDADATAAALREAQEEIGLDPAHARVLGTLDDYVTRTGFRVTPVVAVLEKGQDWAPQEAEVARIFEVPLAHILAEESLKRESVTFEGGERFFYAVYFEGARIWGATAGMLNAFKEAITVPAPPAPPPPKINPPRNAG